MLPKQGSSRSPGRPRHTPESVQCVAHCLSASRLRGEPAGTGVTVVGDDDQAIYSCGVAPRTLRERPCPTPPGPRLGEEPE